MRSVERLAIFNLIGQAIFVLGGLRVAGAPPSVFGALLRAPLLAAWKIPVHLRSVAGRGPGLDQGTENAGRARLTNRPRIRNASGVEIRGIRRGALARVDPLADPAWSELLDRAPGATIFHHPGWLRLLRDQYGYSISAWCLPGGDGRLAGGLPVALVRGRITGPRLVSLPFSDACPPLHDPVAGLEPGALAVAVAEERDRSGLALEVRSELAGAPGEWS